jgi:O-antigen ligase
MVVTVLTDPIGVISRLSGIVDPGEEGSAYIRLLELPNVLQNIAHNPIWGTAIGTQWKQYYRMPSSAVYTTLGTHNTYLYFPLRTGIIGTVGFFWLLGRIWKALLVNVWLSKGDDQKFTTQLFLHMFVIYQVACFFGLMYGDAMSSLLGLILVMLSFEMQEITGLRSYAYVDLLATLRAKRLVYRTPKLIPWLSQRLSAG